MTFAQNRNIFTLCKKSSFCYYFVKRYIFLSLILSKDIFSKQTSKKNCWHTFMLTASPHHSKHHSDHINPSPTHYHILTSPSPSPTLEITITCIFINSTNTICMIYYFRARNLVGVGSDGGGQYHHHHHHPKTICMNGLCIVSCPQDLF